MRLKINILANFVGQGWSILIQLVLVPLYLKLLGIEAYGLVSIYVMLSTSLQVFDLGFAQMLNRELARRAAIADKFGELRDLVHTIEWAYYLLIAAIASALFFALPLLGGMVLHAQTIQRSALMHALGLMIVVIALQWPVNLYQAGLMGLQHQLSANALRVASSTIAGVGAIFCLYFVAPTIEVFFAWQIVAAALLLVASALVFRKRLPRIDRRPRIDATLLRPLWRFSAGVSGLTISAIVLTQMDKWFLAGVLSLKVFGYYALAWTAANGLSLLTAPIFAAIYPRFSSLIARGDSATLTGLYHAATQAIAVLIAPMALLMCLLPRDLLLAWTGNQDVAQAAAPILSVLAAGTLLNSVSHMPYAWELAHGRTSVFLTVNWIFIPAAFPALWFLATHWGAVGAATVWTALNVSYFLIAIPIIHRRFSPDDRRQWWLRDVSFPLAAAAAALGAYAVLVPAAHTRAASVLAIGLGLVLGTAVALLAAPRLLSLVRHTRSGTWRAASR